MKAAREYGIMVLLFAGLPLLLYGALLRPSLQRVAHLEARIREAGEGTPPCRLFTPVTPEERVFLEAPEAPWRKRLPVVAEDGARLRHVDRVVHEVDASLRAAGLRATAIRGALEPVRAQCTLPAHLAQGAPGPAPLQDGPELGVAAWVLEVEVAGTSRELFRAMSALAGAEPLLEPVGLRWQALSEPDGSRDVPDPGGRQSLLLRTFYLKP